MAEPSIVRGDQVFSGAVIFGGAVTLPGQSVEGTNWKTGDAYALPATKVQHQYEKTYAQESNTAAADEARVLHRVRGSTATLVRFVAGSVVANIGAATIAVDLLKNGVSILSAAISLTNAHAAYQAVTAALASTSLVAGDVLEVDIDGTVGGGTLGKGVFCQLELREYSDP